MNNIFEIVKTFDVEPFQAGDGDAFRFRIEISQQVGTEDYFCKVYRLETYRIQPTFPQSNGVLPPWGNDALIFVADEVLANEQLRGHSVDEVLTKFQAELRKKFG